LLDAPQRFWTPSEKTLTLRQTHFQTESHRIASRRLHRAVTLLVEAVRTLDAASRHAGKYNRNRLYIFGRGLRDLSAPLSRLAAQLEKGGAW
jgi:hypothetical protein